MTRPLLLLGVGGPAAYAESTLLQIAQAYPVVLADKDVPPWARPYLTHHLMADPADPSTVLDAVRRYTAQHELGGVLAMNRQYLTTAAQIIHARSPQRSDLPALTACSSPAAVRGLIDHDVLQPQWAVAHEAESVAEHADVIGYPVELRWPDGTGGAVGPAHSRSDVLEMYAHFSQRAFRATPHLNTVLVEQHLSGPRISAEVVVLEDGDIQLVAVTRTTIGPPPAGEALRHTVYAHDELLHNRQLRQTVNRTVQALGVRSCVLHIEMTRTSRGPFVTDVSVHPANDLIPLLVKRATGISLPQAAAALANGELPALAPTRQKAAAVHFEYPKTDGHIRELALTTPAYQRRVERAVLTQHLGSRVNRAGWGCTGDRLAHWVALGDNASACHTALEEMAKTLVVAIAPSSSIVHVDCETDNPPSVDGRSRLDPITPVNSPPPGRAALSPNNVPRDMAVETAYAQFRATPVGQRLLPRPPGRLDDDTDVAHLTSFECFNADDIQAFRTLMAELISTCASIGSRYHASDVWQPLAPSPNGQLSEASEVLADLSRTLNRTRAGIRKLHAQAHRRAVSRAARIAASQGGTASS
jgi:hypothetical protein